MRHLVAGPFVLAASLASLSAQEASSAPPLPRERFAALFLDTAPWPERIEVRGKILVVQDFVAAAKEAEVANDQLARRVLDDLLLAVLTEELQHQKAWLTDAEHDAAYAAYAAPYDKTPFTVSVIATRFKGYPDLATFQRRWRVMNAFATKHKLLEPADADLQEQAKVSRELVTNGAVHVELWLHAASPGADGRRDFAAAEAKARATLAALAAGGDAPKLADDVQHLRPGTKGRVLLNPLRQELREGEYTALHHDAVADAVFAAEPGKLLGPLRGTNGWWIARVERREPGQGKVDVNKPNTKELLRPLVVERRFLAWVDEVLSGTGIRVDGMPFAAK